jgi:hypothetical protein
METRALHPGTFDADQLKERLQNIDEDEIAFIQKLWDEIDVPAIERDCYIDPSTRKLVINRATATALNSEISSILLESITEEMREIGTDVPIVGGIVAEVARYFYNAKEQAQRLSLQRGQTNLRTRYQTILGEHDPITAKGFEVQVKNTLDKYKKIGLHESSQARANIHETQIEQELYEYERAAKKIQKPPKHSHGFDRSMEIAGIVLNDVWQDMKKVPAIPAAIAATITYPVVKSVASWPTEQLAETAYGRPAQLFAAIVAGCAAYLASKDAVGKKEYAIAIGATAATWLAIPASFPFLTVAGSLGATALSAYYIGKKIREAWKKTQ